MKANECTYFTNQFKAAQSQNLQLNTEGPVIEMSVKRKPHNQNKRSLFYKANRECKKAETVLLLSF